VLDATLFDFAADRLEHHSTLDRLEARGTLRIVLKKAGLDTKRVKPDQMGVAIAKLMPRELETRGIEAADSVCGAIVDELATSWTQEDVSHGADSQEVFRRLGDA
jgi:hypothetical protein